MFKMKPTSVNRKNANSILRNLSIVDGKAKLPSTIQKIEADAFKNIDFSSFGINTLILGNFVKKIERYAFFYAKLEKIFIEDGTYNLDLEENAFNTAEITNVEIRRFIREIPSRCFFDSSVNNINIISTGCERIGEYAFCCRNLKEIQLPKSIYYIGRYAFAYTHSLEEIELAISKISVGMFNNSALKKIKVVRVLEKLEIEEEAFQDCQFLKTIETQSPITKIGDNAFSNCERLETIDLSHVTDIGEAAFHNAKSLKIINLNSLNCLGRQAFSDCTKLNNVTIGKDITEIPIELFSGCENMENIEFSTENNKIEKIGFCAFKNCKRLKRIPKMPLLECIEDEAFYDCRSIQEVFFSERLNKIGDNAFTNCTNLREVICTGLIDKIGDSAFFECTNLENVEIHNPLEMGSNVFGKCWNLQNIKFLNNSKGE